jgi:hypothetical protein
MTKALEERRLDVLQWLSSRYPTVIHVAHLQYTADVLGVFEIETWLETVCRKRRRAECLICEGRFWS